MTFEEELADLSEKLKKNKEERPIEFFQRFSYEGITVNIGTKGTIEIQPKGKNFLLEDNRKNIEKCLSILSDDTLLEGIPKKVWMDWFKVKICYAGK